MSPSPLRSTFGRPNRFRETASFRFMVLYLGGRPPYYARARFRFSFRGGQHDPWRLLSRPVVQSSLSKSRLFFPIKSSLMVPGLSMLPYLGYSATGRQTTPTRTSAESVGVKTGHFARNCTFDGPLRIFRPWPHLRIVRMPVSLVILLTLSFLRITRSIYCRVSRFCRT